MKVDIIIVGLGLAGTLLANELIKKGKSIIVFDDPDQPKASKVAAGIVNPIVFKRMTKSWMVDEALPPMEETYHELEELLKVQLYYPTNINRILDKNDTEFWKEKRIANSLEEYIESNSKSADNSLINAQYGLGIVHKAGRLDVPKLIIHFRTYLDNKRLIRNSKFNLKDLKLIKDFICYEEITADKIIFCEGAAASQNPYFSNLKFKSSKGEVIDVQIPDLKLKEILSSEIFMLPVGSDCYKVGATYSWDLLDQQTTETARTELSGKLKSIISSEFNIIRQQAGIRPTMHDRKPVIGFLPDIPQIGIFNGLGSKGVLLGPYFARQLYEYIIDKEFRINAEIDIRRYYS